jgi:hypothetical protein
MKRLIVVGVLLLIWCSGAAAQSPAGGQASKDIKGWLGAEWGMTPEQVGAATNLGLGEPAKTNSNDLGVCAAECERVADRQT